jgi:choloylglycine hydrolase
MRWWIGKIGIVAMAAWLCVSSAAACTTFCLRNAGRIVFGKNYDWNVEEGLLIVNKRGVRRSADAGDTKNPAQWTAKYGSVTFNQYGRDFPSGGMNEAGLVIELMWADGSKYPRPDARPTVNCLEWIQYQLDTAGSGAEVIANDARIRIQSDTPLHYLLADRTGAAATIEFISGKLVAHHAASLPVAALANDLYADSLRHMQNTPWLPPDGGSKARFLRAADRVKNFSGGDAVAYAFETLANVANGDHTKWSIVYEIDRSQLHFRTLSNSRIRTLSLKQLDFSCASPVMVFDLKAGAGDIAPALRPYSRQENLRLIRSSFPQTDFLARTSQAELARIASLPESSTCQIAAGGDR